MADHFEIRYGANPNTLGFDLDVHAAKNATTMSVEPYGRIGNATCHLLSHLRQRLALEGLAQNVRTQRGDRRNDARFPQALAKSAAHRRRVVH